MHRLQVAVREAHERRGIQVTTPYDVDKVLVTRQLAEYEEHLQLLEAQYAVIRHEPVSESDRRKD